MVDIALKVNGVVYTGWTSAEVTRGIETISGSFSLSVRDAAARAANQWPVREEDECTVLVAGKPIVTGYVDKLSVGFDPGQHSMGITGRDRTAALVDCSAVLDKWEFLNTPVLSLAQKLAQPFGVKVTLGAGVQMGASPEKTSIDPGDSPFSVIDKLCRKVGLLPVSDGLGGVQLMRPGSSRAKTELVEGENIMSATGDYDASNRFRRYIVQGQHPGSDAWFGEGTAGIRGEASDADVRRADRVLVVRAEGAMDVAQVKKRAQWEAAVRAARSETVTVTVQGWTQGDGSLWPVNALVKVRSPRLRVNGDMLITETSFAVGSSGTTTQLSLRRPDAFKPEPVVKAGANWWREIKDGV